MKIILIGRPIPLARPRVSFERQSMYDSQRQQKIDHSIEMQFQYRNEPMLSGPVEMEVTFYMQIPKLRKVERDRLLGAPHVSRPDLSNLLKWVEDCAQGIFFEEDAVICSIIAKKVYDKEPRTEFEFRPYTGDIV